MPTAPRHWGPEVSQEHKSLGGDVQRTVVVQPVEQQGKLKQLTTRHVAGKWCSARERSLRPNTARSMSITLGFTVTCLNEHDSLAGTGKNPMKMKPLNSWAGPNSSRHNEFGNSCSTRESFMRRNTARPISFIVDFAMTVALRVKCFVEHVSLEGKVKMRCLDEKTNLDGNVEKTVDVQPVRQLDKHKLLATRRESWQSVFSRRKFLAPEHCHFGLMFNLLNCWKSTSSSRQAMRSILRVQPRENSLRQTTAKTTFSVDSAQHLVQKAWSVSKSTLIWKDTCKYLLSCKPLNCKASANCLRHVMCPHDTPCVLTTFCTSIVIIKQGWGADALALAASCCHHATTSTDTQCRAVCGSASNSER